jgi:hypothetical protein
MRIVFAENMLSRTAWTSRIVVVTPSKSSALIPLNLKNKNNFRRKKNPSSIRNF